MMSKKKKDSLLQLISTLSSAEKRHFKLYARRLRVNQSAKFLRLFDILSRSNKYDECFIIKHTPVSKQQLANMKGHLYRQILISLRLQNTEHDHELQLREQWDFARLLYKRGLYRQSLKSLERAKSLARCCHAHNLLIEMISFERMIESQHITRSCYLRAEELIQEAQGVLVKIRQYELFSNLSLSFYALYIRMGFAQNEQAKSLLDHYFETHRPQLAERASFLEKLMFYQMQLRAHFMLQNLIMCYRYSLKWIRHFREHPYTKNIFPVLYLKGFHYVLEIFFYSNKYGRFAQSLDSFEHAIQTIKDPDKNTSIQSFVYLYIHRIDLYFMKGTFSEGVEKLLPKLKDELHKYETYLDVHQLMIFDYKIACLYFGSGDFISAIHHLEKIINRYKEGLREDLQAFARLLYLLSCYEAEHFDKLEKQIKMVYKFFLQLNQHGKVQHAILRFLRKLENVYPDQLKSEFLKLKEELTEYFEDRYEKRALLYFDIISWLESKIQNKTVQEVIHRKFLKKQGVCSL